MAPIEKLKTNEAPSPALNVLLTKGDWLGQSRASLVPPFFPRPQPLESNPVENNNWWRFVCRRHGPRRRVECYSCRERASAERGAALQCFNLFGDQSVKITGNASCRRLSTAGGDHVTIRSPGTENGMKCLTRENRLQVDFLDDTIFAKRDRCWQTKGKVKSFMDKYSENRMESNGNQFERALKFVEQSNATTEMPKFAAKGTLPLQYKDATADPVAKMRESMGDNAWFTKFADSKARHSETHMYDVVGINDATEDGKESQEESAIDAEPVKAVKPTPTRTKPSPPLEKKRVKVSATARQVKKLPATKRRLLCVKKKLRQLHS
ncbi:unnamed protein product [Phytophthora fragariaefolia]|uniref:Unnamed protein product n=1 Tax=Phytophthora fragariaefolia TaxID=1490495 RepID=A0A9W7D234_9STRA|nr:unnamed protein product [Phytophthora fragariaefolia]